MKSSTRYTVGGILALTTLLSIFAFYNVALAQNSVEKIILDANTIRIQNALEEPVLDIQLLENTDHCLINCHAILKLSPHQDILIPSNPNDNFRWKFIKVDKESPGLESYSFDILESIPYSINTPIYGEENYLCFNNETQKDETCTRTIKTGYNEEVIYKNEYVEFPFWGETLKSGQTYQIRLKGKKFLNNDIEWIPTFLGVPIIEWDWWNYSYNSRFPLYMNQTGSSDVHGIWNATLPTADWISEGLLDSDCKSIRILNESENELWWEFGNWSDETYGCNTNHTQIYVFGKILSSNSTWYVYVHEGYAWGNNTGSLPGTLELLSHSDENAGTAAYDSTNNNNHLSFNGDPTWTSGYFSAGINYDGVGDYLEASDSPSLDITGNITVMAWIKSSVSSGAYDTVVAKWYTYVDEAFKLAVGIPQEGNDYTSFAVTPDGKTASRQMAESSGNNITNNEWHHYVGRYNGSALTVHLDGVMNAYLSYSSGIEQNNKDLRVGAMEHTDPEYWIGDIDEVQIWSEALSDDDIKRNYEQGLSSLGEREDQNFANENQGDTAIENGINQELGPNAAIYSDQQIYIRYADGSQDQGSFDKVTISGNQTWAFNYVTVGDSNNWTNMNNLSMTVYIWEEDNLSIQDITDQVADFISDTKI